MQEDFKKYFVEDKQAKTPSFFLKEDFFSIKKELQDWLIEYGDRTKNTVRYCLHNDPMEQIHVMLIYHPFKKRVDHHCYAVDSYYLVLEGELVLKDLNSSKCLIINEDNFIGKIKANINYSMEVLSDTLLFIEIRGVKK